MSLPLTEIREIRKFGSIAFFFFGCLGTIAFWKQKLILTCVFGFFSLTGSGLIFFPSFLSPVYSIWIKLAHLIGRIITTTILTLAYYLVITPSALIKRFFGGRPLPMKPDQNISSYWVPRKEPAQPRERFKKRY